MPLWLSPIFVRYFISFSWRWYHKTLGSSYVMFTDGFIFIWKQDTEWTPTEASEEKECWKHFASFQCSVTQCFFIKSFRAASTEFYDISWSPDSLCIAAAATDNNAYVGALKSGKWVDICRDHTHFVQGVAWHPRNAYAFQPVICLTSKITGHMQQ